MNLNNIPFRNNYPLDSDQANKLFDAVIADCISLIGYHDASGVLHSSGVFDVVQDRLATEASGFYNTYIDDVPNTLEVSTRLKLYREGVDV